MGRQTLDLNAVYAEEVGEQLENPTFDLESLIDSAIAEVEAHEMVSGVELVRLPAAGAPLPWAGGA